jgi:hypothetical protein
MRFRQPALEDHPYQNDVEIVAVTAKQIDFANVQTGEVVPLMIKHVPAHMAPN